MNLELKYIKQLLIWVLIGWSQLAFSQVAPEKYWIQFTDKDTSAYSVNNPLVYLSQRAIDRRNAQGIAITAHDFPVNQQYIDSIKNTANVTVLLKLKWFNGIVIHTTDTVGLAQIFALDFVDSANSESVFHHGEDESHKMDIEGQVVAWSDTGLGSGEALNYGLATHQNQMLSIDYIHDLGYTGSSMVIAVLDAGFYGIDTVFVLQHLWSNNQLLGTWDFVDNQPVDFSQHSSHGTFVMDCMAANLPGKYVGTAPDAKYWLLRTEDAFTENIIEEYNWVAGAEFADSAGADVFNTSLGYTEYDDSTKSHTYADMDGNTTLITRGADMAASKGILVVNSAGNWGASTWRYMGAPSDGDSVLSVGAVRSDSSIANFSSRGPSFDGRIKPNVLALGQGVPMPISPDSIRYISGTSFAGPIMAGAAACFWESRHTYGNMDVLHAIEKSAHLYSAPNDSAGYGIPNFKFAHFLITGVDNIQTTGASIQVYPNPTKGRVYIPKATKEIPIVSVYDISGRLLLSHIYPTEVEGTTWVDLSLLPTGIYLIKTFTIRNTHIVRIVKE